MLRVSLNPCRQMLLSLDVFRVVVGGGKSCGGGWRRARGRGTCGGRVGWVGRVGRVRRVWKVGKVGRVGRVGRVGVVHLYEMGSNLIQCTM